MGMFDDIKCDYQLPDEGLEHDHFQTKDFDCRLDQYRITKDGRLELMQYDVTTVPDSDRLFGYRMDRNEVQWIDVNFHGDLIMYTYGRDGRFYEYLVRFTEGEVSWVKRLPED